VDVLIVTLFASLILVVGGVLFLAKRVREGDLEHGDRLSLLPLAEDEYSEGDSEPTKSTEEDPRATDPGAGT
jgi:hypothetical protein